MVHPLFWLDVWRKLLGCLYIPLTCIYLLTLLRAVTMREYPVEIE
jgi:hypothetical protein